MRIRQEKIFVGTFIPLQMEEKGGRRRDTLLPWRVF
jgi:hypothetical protein